MTQNYHTHTALKSLCIWRFGAVKSSFDVAWNLVDQNKLDPFDSVLVCSQSQGRGQYRRQWFSPPGNLYACIRLPEEPPFLNEGGAVACGALFVLTMRDLGFTVFLKWPNDVVVVDKDVPKKVGGMLLEERRGRLILGLGLNLRSAPSLQMLRTNAALPAATLDCWQSQFRTVSALYRDLVKKAISNYKNGNFLTQWQRRIAPYLLWLGSKLVLEEKGKEETAILMGIGPSGGLLVSVGCQMREIRNGTLVQGSMPRICE